jgi:hypothetical protein
MATRLVATELAVLRYAVGWRMAPAVPADATPFSYHRGSRLLVWSLLFVAILEIVALHAVISIWSAKAAWTITIISMLGMVYLLGLVNAFARLPLLVSPEGLRVRTGLIIDQRLRFDEIASIETVMDCGDPKRPGFLKASVLAYPNVVVRLRRPMAIDRLLKGPKTCDLIGLHLDAPADFVAAVRKGMGEVAI